MKISRVIEVFPLAAGAALGGTLRHQLTRHASSFKISLLRICAINTAGSFLLGATQSLHARHVIPKHVASALGTGFCGGFTTFSTFAALLLDSGGVHERPVLAGGFASLSCFLGVLGVALGRLAGASVNFKTFPFN